MGMKIEGGHKAGHSNMAHWDLTEWIKVRAKKLRRAWGKRLIKEARKEDV